jgi:deazaflavin-dependent oxidoreductase (nitroreductase family)
MAARRDLSWYFDHVRLYEEDPVAAHDWDSTTNGGDGIVPTLLLTTVGRRSGERRSTPLIYQPCGVGFVVVGSKGGAPQHPAWLLNLLADAHCELKVGRFDYTAIARVADGEERTAFWREMVRVWPAYETYQARTDREIPVVVLDAQPA